MQIIETKVFTFQELSEKAKKSARDWYREDALSYEWYGLIYGDFVDICEILGISLKIRKGSKAYPCIWFSGFSSQGDGACYEGSYSYAKDSCAKIRAHAPQATELHRIADSLQAAQKANFYQLKASIEHSGRYYHAGCMNIAVERDSPNYQAIAGDSEDQVIEALRDLANWLYQALESEHDWLLSDECVDESIIANQYTFTESGKRFD